MAVNSQVLSRDVCDVTDVASTTGCVKDDALDIKKEIAVISYPAKVIRGVPESKLEAYVPEIMLDLNPPTNALSIVMVPVILPLTI
jgi:hypothetical protein